MGTPSRIPTSDFTLTLMLSLSRFGRGKFESGAMLCRISKLDRLRIAFAGEVEGEVELDDKGLDSRIDEELGCP